MSLIRAEGAFRADEEALDARCSITYTWRYAAEREDLRALYEKAKREQWNGSDALDWTIAVDPESEIVPEANNPIFGTDVWNKLTRAEQLRFRRESFAWMLSQFLHGEQGALLTASQIVATVPWIDAKFYAATQVVDEARHVEVYERYLRE